MISMDNNKESCRGKQPNQKIKPYLILQYLIEETDETHVKNGYEIADHLEDLGISAERQSVYRDIKEINKAAVMLQYGCGIEEAEEMLEDDEDDELKLIVYYNHHKKDKGYYVKQNRFSTTDIQLLAECVHSAKFMSESESKRLMDIVCSLVSKYQAERIRHDALLINRTKSNNKNVINNINTINEAMSKVIEGEPHTPEKITFKYLKYTIDDLNKQVERRKGATYKVSPYKLLINDGQYYLLAYDDKKKAIITYRVDRMKGVSFTGEAREGLEAFSQIDLKEYTRRVFSMYSGKNKRVTLRFINKHLDTMIDRFGKDHNYVLYKKDDDTHSLAYVNVDISNQFFGWLLGFGKEVKIISPLDVVEDFKAYLDKIRGMY